MSNVEEIGNQMAKLSKEDAEALREYLIETYGILPGCVEGLVWAKYGDRRPRPVSEFFVDFCLQFVVRG